MKSMKLFVIQFRTIIKLFQSQTSVSCVCAICVSIYLQCTHFFLFPFYYLMLFIGSKSRCYRELCIIEHFSLIKFTCFLCIDGKHFSSSMYVLCVCVCVYEYFILYYFHQFPFSKHIHNSVLC